MFLFVCLLLISRKKFYQYLLQFFTTPILTIAYAIIPTLQVRKLSFLELKRLDRKIGINEMDLTSGSPGSKTHVLLILLKGIQSLLAQRANGANI